MTEHAKDPEWITPMKRPGVKPGTYDSGVESGSGSREAAATKKGEAGQGKDPSDPSGKHFTKVSEGAKQIIKNSQA